MSNFPIQIPNPQFSVPLPIGQAGLNAYQLAVMGAPGVPPFVGTMAEWLASLEGPQPDLSTDPALGDSDVLAPSQKAVKTYVDTHAASLGTAAFTASTDYATAAQGALADTALQPADILIIDGGNPDTIFTATLDGGSP